MNSDANSENISPTKSPKEMKKMKMTEGERKETEWWCNHHKNNAGYLAMMWRRYFDAIDEGDQKRSDEVLTMMHAQLPAFEQAVK